jgi:hypothetical protein
MPAMSKFDDFLAGVKDGLAPLVTDFAAGLRKDAVDDMLVFLARKKDDLLRWTDLLARGQITQREFEMLVKGAKSLLKLRALRVAGVQLARVQRLRSAFIDLVLEKAIGTFLPG